MTTVRKYKKGDEKAIWQIKHDTIRKVNINDYSEQQVQAWAPDIYNQEQWTKRIKEMNPFVAEIDGNIVGYADVQSDGYIDHFFCHYEYQGLGIGKALMQSIFKKAQAERINRLYSHVSITAKPFFAHFGFITIKQQRVEVREQELTNFVMENTLKKLDRLSTQ